MLKTLREQQAQLMISAVAFKIQIQNKYECTNHFCIILTMFMVFSMLLAFRINEGFWVTSKDHWIVRDNSSCCKTFAKYYLAHIIKTTKFTNSESQIFCLLAWLTVGWDTLQFINWNHATFSNSVVTVNSPNQLY